jgi:hypothetical protein
MISRNQLRERTSIRIEHLDSICNTNNLGRDVTVVPLLKIVCCRIMDGMGAVQDHIRAMLSTEIS